MLAAHCAYRADLLSDKLVGRRQAAVTVRVAPAPYARRSSPQASEPDDRLTVRNPDGQMAGDARLEARAVEVQANERSVRVQAMEQIFLDGSHIGLNDDPSPTPFDWSAIAKEKG